MHISRGARFVAETHEDELRVGRSFGTLRSHVETFPGEEGDEAFAPPRVTLEEEERWTAPPDHRQLPAPPRRASTSLPMNRNPVGTPNLRTYETVSS